MGHLIRIIHCRNNKVLGVSLVASYKGSLASQPISTHRFQYRHAEESLRMPILKAIGTADRYCGTEGGWLARLLQRKLNHFVIPATAYFSIRSIDYQTFLSDWRQKASECGFRLGKPVTGNIIR